MEIIKDIVFHTLRFLQKPIYYISLYVGLLFKAIDKTIVAILKLFHPKWELYYYIKVKNKIYIRVGKYHIWKLQKLWALRQWLDVENRLKKKK